MTETTTPQVTRTIDARGSFCPGPLMELIRGMKESEVAALWQGYVHGQGTARDDVELALPDAAVFTCADSLAALVELGACWAEQRLAGFGAGHERDLVATLDQGIGQLQGMDHAASRVERVHQQADAKGSRAHAAAFAAPDGEACARATAAPT